MAKVRVKKSAKVGEDHRHLFVIKGLPFYTDVQKDNSPHAVDLLGDEFETSEADDQGFHTVELESGEVLKTVLPGELLDVEIRKRVNLQVQQIFISNTRFKDIGEAVQWADSKGFETTQVETTKDGFILPQMARDRFKEESLKPFELQDGVTLSVGVLDPEKISDVENPSFDRMGDKQGADQLALSDEQVGMLAQLKDEFSQMLAEIKQRANDFIPVLNQFIEFSEAVINNEPFDLFLTQFLDSFQQLTDDLSKLELAEKETTQKEESFEDMVREILPLLKSTRDIFEESESFPNFGELIAKNDDNFEQMLLNFPLIRQEAGEHEIVKMLDPQIDLNKMSFGEIDNLTAEEISKMEIKPFEYDETKARQLWDKFFTKDSAARVSLNDETCAADHLCIGRDLLYDVNKGIPLPSKSLDEVRAYNALEFLENETRAGVFAEAHRVLKSGGTFFIHAASTDGQNAFLPQYRSYWNESVVKVLAKDKFEIDSIETLPHAENDKEYFIKAILRKV